MYELNLAGETDGLRGRKDNFGKAEFVFQPLLNMVNIYHRNDFRYTRLWSGLDAYFSENVNFKLPTDRTFDGESLVPVLSKKH